MMEISIPGILCVMILTLGMGVVIGMNIIAIVYDKIEGGKK